MKIFTVLFSVACILLALPHSTTTLLADDVPKDLEALTNEYQELYRNGKYEQAVAVAKELLKAEIKHFGPEHANVASALYNIAFLYHKLGKYAEAEPYAKRLLAMDEKLLGKEHPDLADDLDLLGDLYRAQGKASNAEATYRRALPIRQSVGPKHPDVATAALKLALVCDSQGKYREADPLYKQAVGVGLFRLQKNEEKTIAENLFDQALDQREKKTGDKSLQVAALLEVMSEFYKKVNMTVEAQKCQERAKRIRQH